MACSSCSNLDESKKKKGAVSGAKYYCKKLKTYVGGDFECEKYEKSYMRKNFTCDDIYNEGRQFYDDDKPTSHYVIILIVILLFGLLAKLLGF